MHYFYVNGCSLLVTVFSEFVSLNKCSAVLVFFTVCIAQLRNGFMDSFKFSSCTCCIHLFIHSGTYLFSCLFVYCFFLPRYFLIPVCSFSPLFPVSRFLLSILRIIHSSHLPLQVGADNLPSSVDWSVSVVSLVHDQTEFAFLPFHW